MLNLSNCGILTSTHEHSIIMENDISTVFKIDASNATKKQTNHLVQIEYCAGTRGPNLQGYLSFTSASDPVWNLFEIETIPVQIQKTFASVDIQQRSVIDKKCRSEYPASLLRNNASGPYSADTCQYYRNSARIRYI